MNKFKCSHCGGEHIEEFVECDGISTKIDLTGNEPVYVQDSAIGIGEVYSVRIVCSDCGEPLLLKDGNYVCDLDDLCQYFNENEIKEN